MGNLSKRKDDMTYSEYINKHKFLFRNYVMSMIVLFSSCFFTPSIF